LRLY